MPSNSAASSGTEASARLRIDSLRVRLPGRDQASGHAFANALSSQLAALAPLLEANGAGPLELERLRVSLPAGEHGASAAAASAAIRAAILRALRAQGRDF